MPEKETNMKLNKKEVKLMKKILVLDILNQINSKKGYVYDIACSPVSQDFPYVEDLGIDNGFSHKLGDTLSKIEFASEEAKRQVRDTFPGQAGFITWAWYN